jgi:hypothetical protein
MSLGSPESARLVFKRAFASYFLDLNSLAIADPSEAFATCRAYLSLSWAQLGADEFMRRLDDDTTDLACRVEQDLRRWLRDRGPQPSYDELEDRLRECFEQGMRHLDATPTEISVE